MTHGSKHCQQHKPDQVDMGLDSWCPGLSEQCVRDADTAIRGRPYLEHVRGIATVILGLDCARVDAEVMQTTANLSSGIHKVDRAGHGDVDRRHHLRFGQLPHVQFVHTTHTPYGEDLLTDFIKRD
jgi:hypothetical protein